MAELVDNSISAKNTMVELIRDELRDEMDCIRKQQRNSELNKNRLALGESTDEDLTVEFVTTMTKNLRKKSLNIKDYRKLQNALIQSEDHINAFFKVDNAIHGLVRDLSGWSTQSKLAAANCCCNLALGDSKACLVICKFALPYLIEEIESTSEPLAEVCIWTIGNLVCTSDKAFSFLHAQQCMKSLIKLAQQCSDTLLPAVSYTCLRYIQAANNCMESEYIVQLGEIMMHRYPKVSDANTLWLIAILSSELKCHDYLQKCIPVISTYLFAAINNQDENVVKISAALRIICNSVSEPTGQIAQYLFCGENEKNCIILDKLLSHQHTHIRMETLWLIGNLYNHNLDSIKQIAKSIISTLPSLKLAATSIKQTQ